MSWATLLGADPIPWVLEADEPWARYEARILLGQEAETDRLQALAHPAVRALIDGLPDWSAGAPFPGHHSPAFAANTLHLLADLGLRGGEEPLVEAMLDQVLEHRHEALFQAFYKMRGMKSPDWGTLPCDHHPLTAALVRLGRAEDPRVQQAITLMESALGTTDMGPGWGCRPHSLTGGLGPGRKAECCPMVHLQALRVLHGLGRSQGLEPAARTALEVWHQRYARKPYMFGHGYRFKVVKWPVFWYSSFWLVDVLGRFPEAWRSDDQARQCLAEVVAVLLAYNTNDQGQVVPRSTYKGFTGFDFGQKKQPSPWATARLCAVLAPLAELAEEVGGVDVLGMPTTKREEQRPARPPRA